MRIGSSLLAILTASICSCTASGPDARRILSNDNRTPAGTLKAGTLSLQLEVRAGDWYPDSDTGLSQRVLAFAESGKPLQIPGPLIRVPAGTAIHAILRNTLDTTLVVHGFFTRPAAAGDSILLAPHAVREVVFDAGAPGTYFYWGTLPGISLTDRQGSPTQLSGAFVVDSAAADASDRVFVIGVWNEPVDSNGPKPWVPRDVMVINGKMWPYTERFRYTAGDSVHWRWVNPSADAHPMHLHGFYYSVVSHGAFGADTTYPIDERRTVVTEMLTPGATMSLQWEAARAGNWLFHCHFAFHVSHFLSLHKIPDPADPAAPDAMSHSPHVMSGLVLGIEVQPRSGSAPPPSATVPPRRLRLVARPVAPTAARDETYGFFLQGAGVAAGDSANPLLLLRRNEPVRITVVNRLRAATSVHWHGIELAQSYADGVPDWSGDGRHLAPAIAPGDSLTVEFTPPRAGSYMYHSHSNEEHQIANGLYAPLLVLEDRARYDAGRDRVFLFGGDEGHGRINRQQHPASVRMHPGTTYRLRLININVDQRAVFSLWSGTALQQWRPVAKDGADLPPPQATERSARLLMGPGEIADFEFTPAAPGTLELRAVADVDSTRRVVAPIEVR